jgi:hypothetical protein
MNSEKQLMCQYIIPPRSLETEVIIKEIEEGIKDDMEDILNVCLKLLSQKKLDLSLDDN